MAGYSQTPLIKKLGIKPGARVIFINEPVSIYKAFGQVPTGIKTTKKLTGGFDYIHFFAMDNESLSAFFKSVKKFLKKDGALWISWPKKSSGINTDLNENAIREAGLKNGLVDVKVAAIDDTWSGLKFVYRVKDR